jgi:hypothetical protein
VTAPEPVTRIVTRELLMRPCSAFPKHNHATPDPCPALAHLFILAAPLAHRLIPTVLARPGWGIVVALPDVLCAQTAEERAELEEARARGVYVAAMPLELMLAWAAASKDPRFARGLREQLLRPAPPGAAHVLARLDDHVMQRPLCDRAIAGRVLH